MTPITRAYQAEVDDVNQKERMITARINTSAVDRYRTMIDPMGGDFANYERNRVVLWEHGKDPGRGSLPIGVNRWIKSISGKSPEIRARTQFHKDEYSQLLFEHYRDGNLRGWSVNVLPKEGTFGPPTYDELRARPELSECETVYRKWDLAEYSAVAVPGNADTLSLLEQRGIWVPDEARTTPDQEDQPEAEAKDKEPDADDEGEQDQEYRYIRKRGEKWVVYSEAGKALGEHDSRESAVKQLQAIEAHKHSAGRSFAMIHREMSEEFRCMEIRLIGKIKDFFSLMDGRV